MQLIEVLKETDASLSGSGSDDDDEASKSRLFVGGRTANTGRLLAAHVVSKSLPLQQRQQLQQLQQSERVGIDAEHAVGPAAAVTPAAVRCQPLYFLYQ
jgi:hypothetical protein